MANGWSRKLSEPVKTENGRILKTLSDVRDLILRLGESEIKHAWWVYAGEWAESSGWAKFRMRRCNCASETAHCRARPEFGNLRDAVFFAGRIKVFVFGDPLLNILRRHPRIRRTSSIRDVACAWPRLH